VKVTRREDEPPTLCDFTSEEESAGEGEGVLDCEAHDEIERALVKDSSDEGVRETRGEDEMM
jgi:hypothetical protein